MQKWDTELWKAEGSETGKVVIIYEVIGHIRIRLCLVLLYIISATVSTYLIHFIPGHILSPTFWTAVLKQPI